MRHFIPRLIPKLIPKHIFFFFLSFLLVCFTVFSSSFPISTFAQQDPKLQVPDTIEGAKEGVLNIGDKIIEAIPRAIAGIWNNKVIPAWKKMGAWIKTEVWEKRVLPAIQTIADRVKELLGKEVEKRKPIIEQEFEKEKEEFKEDIKQGLPDVKASLWDRFQALFHKDD